MWRKVFHVAVCWLTLSDTFGKADKNVNSSIIKDNDSAESVPRLYRNIPVGVYASAAPYAAFSYHVPTLISAPRAAASRVIPVKEQLVLHNANGYLRDSYGNRFVGTPQTASYRTTFPQQFLPLQELPSHLAQPLLATAAQAKQAAPHYFVGQQYRAPTFQVAALSPSGSFGGYSQPIVYTENVKSFGSVPFIRTSVNGVTTAQNQPNVNKAVYANNQSLQQYQHFENEPKFQRLEHRPEVVHDRDTVSVSEKQQQQQQQQQQHQQQQQQQQRQQLEQPQQHNIESKIQAAPAQTSVTAIVNGKKTVINLETRPPLPLLDLSLLEPLTFSNPLVPQIQHFLPKISEATYYKLPEFPTNDAKQHKKEVVIQKTKSYDSGIVKNKPSNSVPKKKQKQKPAQNNTSNLTPASFKPTITFKGVPNKSPEFSYEINSPNYKETYKEQSVSYNKATDTDPVQYIYDKKTQSDPINYSYHKTVQKEPVHYNIVRTSQEPVQIKHVTYQGNAQGPRQLIYTFKPEDQHDNQSNTEDADSQDDSGSLEDSGSAEVSDGEKLPQQPGYSHHNEESLRHAHSQSNLKPEHREEKYHHRPDEQVAQNLGHYNTRHYSQLPKVSHKQKEPQFQPVHNFEEHIHLLSPQTYTSPHEVQQVHHVESIPSPSPGPVHHRYTQHQNMQASTPQPQLYHYRSPPVIHEKAKRIIIQEESPEEVHSHREQIMAEMIDQEDNNEEDFEKAYKNAAYGFPAYNKKLEDVEKDIYDPTSYGFTRDGNFEIEKSPFQEYQAEGDKFPKSARLSYKDARDNTKEDYYLDYSISRPESLADRYNNKADYYKLYKKYRPEKYFVADQNEKQQKKKEKYIVSPSYDFQPEHGKKSNNYHIQYKEDPKNYEFDYAKEAPRDSTAYASRPNQRLKSKTHFVEPQFQYGFEPSALPRLLDSELAAMASNNSPESEKPGTRKKVYKENWYIKKTSTTGGKPS